MVESNYNSDDLFLILCHDDHIYKKMFYPYDREYLFHYFTTNLQKDVLIFYHFYIQYRKYDFEDCFKFFKRSSGRNPHKDYFKEIISWIFLIDKELEAANQAMDIDRICFIKTGKLKFQKGEVNDF